MLFSFVSTYSPVLSHRFALYFALTKLISSCVCLLLGTAERVCLISGTAEAIMEVLTFIMEKIREKPDLSKAVAVPGENYDNGKANQDRDKQVSG